MPAPVVLLLNAFDAHGGSQRVGAAAVKALRQLGARVTVRLGFGGAGFFTDAGNRAAFAIREPARRKLLYPVWLIGANLAAARTLARGGMVWINAVYALPAVLAGLAAPRRVVVHVHELEMPGIFRSLLGLFARRGAKIVAVSSDHARRLSLPAAVVWNSVGETPPAPPSARTRLVFVGDGRPFKGLDLFLAAAPLTHLEPHAFLAGTPADYPEAVHAQARSSGTTLHFGVTDPAAMLHNAALALQLTDPAQVNETFSLTTAEAVWHLVPVGSTGAAAVAEVAGPALAFAEPSRDPRRLADAINLLLADAARCAALVAAAETQRGRLSHARFRADVARMLADLAPHG